VSLNPTKPVAIFIDYTLKPLFDTAREVLEIAEKQGLPAGKITRITVFLFIFQIIMDLIKNLIITGAICYTFLSIMK